MVVMGWVKGAMVGRGSFGTVHLATVEPAPTDTREGCRAATTPLIMAVKSSLLSESATLALEKKVLAALSGCPEVVACYGDAVSTESDGRQLYNLFLEYIPGGTLSDLCRKRPLPEDDVRRYTRSLLRGLRRVHAAGYVHCDVKPQNILVDGLGGTKLVDFGLAKRTGVRLLGGGRTLRGTFLYMAPESVEEGEHEPPSDVWSLGCVVSEMVTGEPAGRRRGCSDAMAAAALILLNGSDEESPDIPEEMSEQGKDFLTRCFIREPSKRWTAEMLLSHPFVAEAEDDEHNRDSPFLSGENAEEPTRPSPRNVFEFPTWVSAASLVTSVCSPSDPSQESSSPAESDLGPASRLQRLMAASPWQDWDSSSGDGKCRWITVREGEDMNRGLLQVAEPICSAPSPESCSHVQLRPSPVDCGERVGGGEECLGGEWGSVKGCSSSLRQPCTDYFYYGYSNSHQWKTRKRIILS